MKRFRLSSDASSFRGRNAERGRKTWPDVSCAQELNFLDFPELLLRRRIDGVGCEVNVSGGWKAESF